VWKIRLTFLIVTAVLSCFQKSAAQVRDFANWVQFLAIGCLLGSLAWAGHGQEGTRWHLLADVAHLLAAGVWPAGLLPLLLLLRNARKVAQPKEWPFMSDLVSRFSAVSLLTVLLLAVAGRMNAMYLVGGFSNLVGEPYGRWLLAKIVFFSVAVVIASVNLFRLNPRLISERFEPEKAMATAARFQTNLQFEVVMGSGIVAVVAVLGTLPAAVH
jgi:copper resistance protein D